MATKKKMLQAAAGNAAAYGGAGGLDVSEVFSTYLYEGNSASSTTTTQKITNDIDLSTEGGLVWIKKRNGTAAHALVDTERGGNKELNTAASTLETTADSSQNIAFNTDGFTMTGYYLYNATINKSSETYASWTFRKAPKFFTCVQYAGNGVAGRTISHDLGGEVGCLIVKRTDTTGEWMVWHKDVAAINSSYALQLQSTNAAAGFSTSFNSTAPTSTEFTLGNNSKTNNASGTYVAYLFAHNDGDGDFGPTGDQDIIKCGSYTGTGSSGNFIDLGFEPQFMLIKNTSSSSNWIIHDNMRGMIESKGNVLFPNLTATENTTAFRQARPNATGITFFDGNSETNGSGANYIYIAIRRGPMAVPESATDVFATAFDAGATNPTYVSGFVADMGIQTNTTGYNKRVSSRLTSGSFLEADNTAAESTSGSYTWDFMNGWNNQSINSTWLSWMWKRAPSFCDVVAYTGNGTAGRTVSHNLGVAPEMMWVKNRNNTTDWVVYHKAIGNSKIINLNDSYFAYTQANFNNTDPTSSVFTLGSIAGTNGSNQTFIAYLFASLDGISKVGSFTTTGSDVNVDCGFSSGGARFVLWKRTDSAGSWNLMDSERGIVAGNDPFLNLNQTTAENNTVDLIDPYSSGFTVAGGGLSSGGTYIFYAIA